MQTDSVFAEQLVRALPFPAWVCDVPRGAIRLWNREAAALWGRDPIDGEPCWGWDGFVRRPSVDGLPLSFADSPMARAIRTGNAASARLTFDLPDGSTVTAEVHSTPLLGPDGRITSVMTVFEDLSDSRRAAEALRLSEARYRAIVEDQPDLVCRFLADGTMTFANEAYCAYFGRRREDLVGRAYAPVVHPDDAGRVRDAVQGLAPSHPVIAIENRVMRGDGAVRWMQWTNRALFDDRGTVVEYQSAGRDITDSKRGQAILAGLYRLAGRIARSPGLIEVCEAAVDAIVEVAGADRASVLVFDAHDVMRFMAWRGLSEDYRRAVEGHSPWTKDTEHPTPILVEDALADPGLGPYRDVIVQEGIRALAFIPLVHQDRLLGKFMLYHDTPYRYSEDEIRLATTIAHHVAFGIVRAQSDLAVADALARERAARAEADSARADAERSNTAKDEFLAMLAHELRNPLGVVGTALGVLERTTSDDPRHQRSRLAIRRQTDHLARLLDDLLDVSRITRGRIELHRTQLDLRSVVDSVVEAHRHRIESKRQTITVVVPPEPVIVDGDSVRLQQVLDNLLNNAWKYTGAGGSIAVTLEAGGSHARLRVRDTGSGIAPDRLEWIFDLFTQAEPTLAHTEGGLGIGLTVARRLAELHGGQLSATSAGANRGAEFTLELPLAERASLPAPSDTPPVEVRRKRVLVIEDHDEGREMLVTILSLHGHDVRDAATGRQGLEEAAAHPPDAVLLDIGLPDLDGYAVARELRRRFGSGIRLVALTGYGRDVDRERSKAAGFDEHLLKPLDPDRLLTVLEDEPAAESRVA